MRPVKSVILKEADKAVRLKFARQWVRRSWKNVMVTDSKYFDLIPQPGKSVGAKVWVLYGHQPPEVPVSKTSFRLHVYGGVSKYGRTPLFAVTGTTGIKSQTKGVGAPEYIQLLQSGLLPAAERIMKYRHGNRWVWQQDGAPAHRAKSTQSFLARQPFSIMVWPPHSPDLSWIESIWAWMETQLNKRKDLTRHNFQQIVNETWEAIPHKVLDAQFGSIHNRLTECIQNKGGLTRY
jgi:hypothetical protein